MLRYLGFIGGGLLLCSMLGCGKPGADTSKFALDNNDSVVADPSLSFHWLGKERLASDSSASNLVSLWNQPESLKLQGQTLDKLASAPWRLRENSTGLSNAPAALLRQLLDDLVRSEWYVEAGGDTNYPGEIGLAIKLTAERAALWRTNLSIVLPSLLAVPTSLSVGSDERDGDLTIQNSKLTCELTRSEDWTIMTITQRQLNKNTSNNGGAIPNADRPSLKRKFQQYLQLGKLPYDDPVMTGWCAIHIDLQQLSSVWNLNLELPSGFPIISLSCSGDGQNIHTRGQLDFATSLVTNLGPWQVPDDLIRQPLVGFTAMRSWQPVFERLGVLTAAQASNFPSQFFLWQRSGPPLQTYFAFPENDAKQEIDRWAVPTMNWVNHHADPRRFGNVEWDNKRQRLVWKGLSFCQPFVGINTNSDRTYIHGGFGLFSEYTQYMPPELRSRLSNETNLLYFSWEHTVDALPQWRYLDDISRIIFDAAHAARLGTHQASLRWMEQNLTNLAHCVTEVRLNSPRQLEITRKSTIGLSGLEIDLLANWLELPEFPFGFASFWRTNATPFVPFHRRVNVLQR